MIYDVRARGSMGSASCVYQTSQVRMPLFKMLDTGWKGHIKISHITFSIQRYWIRRTYSMTKAMRLLTDPPWDAYPSCIVIDFILNFGTARRKVQMFSLISCNGDHTI